MVRFSRVRRSVLRMGHPQIRWAVLLMTQHRGIPAALQGDRAGVGALPLKAMECAKSHGEMFCRHAAWLQVAEAVLESTIYIIEIQ